MSVIAPREWESRSALLAHMDGFGGRTMVIGTEAEAPRRFYSFALPGAQGSCGIGVLSSGLGTKPAAALLHGQRRAAIGHDTWITWLDLDNLAVLATQRLDGVFYEFVRLDGGDELLVLHELGAMRVDARATVSWSVSTDVVEHAGLDDDGHLVITEMGAPDDRVIDVESGQILRVPR